MPGSGGWPPRRGSARPHRHLVAVQVDHEVRAGPPTSTSSSCTTRARSPRSSSTSRPASPSRVRGRARFSTGAPGRAARPRQHRRGPCPVGQRGRLDGDDYATCVNPSPPRLSRGGSASASSQTARRLNVHTPTRVDPVAPRVRLGQAPACPRFLAQAPQRLRAQGWCPKMLSAERLQRILGRLRGWRGGPVRCEALARNGDQPLMNSLR
jgi:hypothetical protein